MSIQLIINKIKTSRKYYFQVSIIWYALNHLIYLQSYINDVNVNNLNDLSADKFINLHKNN